MQFLAAKILHSSCTCENPTTSSLNRCMSHRTYEKWRKIVEGGRGRAGDTKTKRKTAIQKCYGSLSLSCTHRNISHAQTRTIVYSFTRTQFTKMCTSECTHTHTYARARTRAHTHTYTHAHTHTHTHTHINSRTHPPTHTFTCIQLTSTNIHTHTSVYVNITHTHIAFFLSVLRVFEDVHMVCFCVYVYVCMCVCV